MTSFSEGRYAAAREHFEAALSVAGKFGSGDPRLGTSLNNLAGVCEVQALYERAESLYRRALSVKEATLGPSHLGVSVSLNNLALLYDRLGRYDESVAMYRRALAIREKALGADDPEVALIHNNLGVVETHRARYDAAGKHLRRALAIREAREGQRHPAVAETLTNLGDLERARGRIGQGRKLYQRALAIRESALGGSHPDLASTLNGLAATWRAEGNLDEALRIYERALAIREDALGPEHPDVATSLNNLALVVRARGDDERARRLYERALAIWDEAFGGDHPDVAAVLNNLASLHRAQGRLDEAESLLERSVEISERMLRPDHPELAIRLRNLAEVQIANDRVERARPTLERALRITREAFQPGHPQRVQLEEDLRRLTSRAPVGEVAPPARPQDAATPPAADTDDPRSRARKLAALIDGFEREGRHSESAALRQELLSIREEALGHEGPELAPILRGLVDDSIATGRLTDAEQALQRAYDLTGAPEDRLAILEDLSIVYRLRGKYVEAESACREAIRIVEETGGAGGPTHVSLLVRLAFVSVDRGDYEGAETAYLAAINGADPSTRNGSDLAAALEGYARLLWRMGRSEEARALDARVRGLSS